MHNTTRKWFAGSKGLNMTLVEWQALKAFMGEVDSALKPFEDRRGAVKYKALNYKKDRLQILYFEKFRSNTRGGGALSGKVILQMCGLGRVPFRPSG